MRPTEAASDALAILRARWYFRKATTVGSGVRVWGHPSVRIAKGQMVIGQRAAFNSTTATLELVADGGRLEIGSRSIFDFGCSIAATQLVCIGSDCIISKHCILMDNDFHRLEPERRNERPPSAPIILEDKVWLGSRVIVLRGVRIGTGSVVGAGSVVTRDIPPRSLAVGIPARIVGQVQAGLP